MRLLAVLALLVPMLAWGQAYPTKPVRMVIGFPAGGPADIFGRSLAQGMSADFGQPVIVENISGVGGGPGVGGGVKAAPRGYTLVWHSASPPGSRPHPFPELPHDTKKGITPI